VKIDLLMGSFESAPDNARILHAIVAANMLFHLAVAAEQSVGQSSLGCPLHSSCPGLSRPNRVHRVENETRFHRGGACPLQAVEVAQGLVGEQRSLTDGIYD